MIKTTQKTYQQQIWDSRLYAMAQEAGVVYSATLAKFWEVYNSAGIWMSTYDQQAYMKDKIESPKLLGGDSYLGALQLVGQNLKAYKEALKSYNKNSKRFSGKPMPPTKAKFFAPIIFKQDQIHLDKFDGSLLLSLRKGNAPIRVRWSLEQPVYATITWNKSRGWLLNTVFEDETLQLKFKKNSLMTVDLGSLRIAATFDGKNTVTYNGKYARSLVRLSNKVTGELQALIAPTTFGSRRNDKLRRAKRERQQRIHNQKKDFLHKTSKQMIDYCIVNRIGTVVFGDLASVHDGTNLKKETQQVQQCPEQQLRKYFTSKFEAIGGSVKLQPEYYTSQQCPSCGHRHKPKSRTYKCSKCPFVFDRDGVGAINQFVNVSREVRGKPLSLRVVGGLAPPTGVRYRDCLVRSS